LLQSHASLGSPRNDWVALAATVFRNRA